MTKIESAVLFAVKAHDGQKRKGKNRPYILHPLEVMTIVAGLTEDEDVIAAAVLHDTVEDTAATRQDIEANFGKKIAALVAAESENKREEQRPEDTWETRKRETIAHLSQAGQDVKLICLGDKLANLREIARDYAELGDKLWERFNQKDRQKHGWYYSEIFKLLEEEFGNVAAIREYRELLTQLFDGKTR